MKQLNPSHRLPKIPVLGAIAFLVAASTSTGCFRATGTQRTPLSVEEIPVVGGHRVGGLKSSGGPGDFYMGNDFLEIAVSGSRFGQGDTLLQGGSILDASYVGLDNNYQPVSMPGDQLEQLAVVVNQDPDLKLVFDRYQLTAASDPVSLEARGYLLDAKGKLALPRDAAGRVSNVDVVHRFTLDKLSRFVLLETTVSNRGSAEIPVKTIGDFLQQQGGGYRVNVPAYEDLNGRPLTNWGVDIPGNSFDNPIGSSVKATMVTFMGNEPGAATLDSHGSIGILPLEDDALIVTSDPQPALSEPRPRFAPRLVAGKLPGGSLAAGASLTYRRRLYVGGGSSTSISGYTDFPDFLAAQACGLMNLMEIDRAGLRSFDFGMLVFNTFGTAQVGGPMQTEVRFERNIGGSGTPVWKLERVDWQEMHEISGTVSSPTVVLPVGTYRIMVRNRDKSLVVDHLTNTQDTDRKNLAVPVLLEKSKTFLAKESLAPERDEVLNAFGDQIMVKNYPYYLSARATGGDVSLHLQPARFTIRGAEGTPDPVMQRTRSMAGYYNAVSKAKEVLGTNVAAYQFRTGNQVFGASFISGVPATVWTPPGYFDIFCTRGPLSYLDTFEMEATPSYSGGTTQVIVKPAALPTGWTAFDIPAPTQATSGGMLPCEMLSSALSEGVSVVALAEQDRHTSARGLYDEFRSEFFYTSFTDDHRSAILADPMLVQARSTDLRPTTVGQHGYGTAVALFVPDARSDKRGGARDATGWTLADFLVQSQGGYHVVRRPRDPQNGLFTLQGFSRTVPLGTGANAWWTSVGPFSGTTTHGSFDALELLHAEGFDPANPAAWFDEFKAVRSDWFAILNQQTPANFTKALGCSAARYSYDNPVGHARTYLKVASDLAQDKLDPVLQALRAGSAVASTGPLLDVTINGAGPGGTGTASGGSVTVQVNLFAPDWLPVDELRIVANGQVLRTIPVASLGAGADWRQRSGSFIVQLPTAKDAWVLVEAGVALTTTGRYAAGAPWADIMRGIYPIAVTNPVFLDVNGGGYTPPGL